jgi:hypothetical protein
MGRRTLLGAVAALLMLALAGSPAAADDTDAPAAEGLLGNLDLGTCAGLGWGVAALPR